MHLTKFSHIINLWLQNTTYKTPNLNPDGNQSDFFFSNHCIGLKPGNQVHMSIDLQGGGAGKSGGKELFKLGR